MSGREPRIVLGDRERRSVREAHDGREREWKRRIIRFLTSGSLRATSARSGSVDDRERKRQQHRLVSSGATNIERLTMSAMPGVGSMLIAVDERRARRALLVVVSDERQESVVGLQGGHRWRARA